jgi:signal transduction histidine kinase
VTRAQGGTGVGLAVARGVARGHDGDLVLRSEGKHEIGGVPFSGACFSMTIAPELGANLGAP